MKQGRIPNELMPRAASRRRRDQLVAGLEALQTSVPDTGNVRPTPFNPSQPAPTIEPPIGRRRARAAEHPLGGSHQQPSIGFRPRPRRCLRPDLADDGREAWSLLPMAGPPVGIKGHMDIAYLSTLSALAGSVVGGLTSGVATWLSQRAQARESQLAREMARRDDLYKEFIAARRHTVKPL